MAPTSDAHDRIKVFVSYSRVDKAFADELVMGLKACGFAAYIDREDIAAGEDWAKRLGGLIADADTVVYVMSPDSTNSEQCAWEVQETLRRSKRLLPVVWRPVDDAQVPEAMKRLNYIFFTGDGHSFASGLSNLSDALRIDIDWIREHTRLAALAHRWEERSKSDALVLRHDELDAALKWASSRPKAAPSITDIQDEYLKAGVEARKAAERARRNRLTGLLAGTSMAAVIMAGLAGVAFYLMNYARDQEQIAHDQFVRADQTAQELAIANSDLASANQRLSANIGLRTAPSNGYLDVPGGWFPVAANFSGAVARIERRSLTDDTVYQVGSGLLIDGALLHDSRAGETLLLTPLIYGSNYEDGSERFNPTVMMNVAVPGALAEGEEVDFTNPDLTRIAQTRISSAAPLPDDHKVVISVPVLNQELTFDAIEKIWTTPDELGGVQTFEIWTLNDTSAIGARPITNMDIDCSDPYGLIAMEQPLSKKEWVATFGIDAGGTAYSGDRTATLFVSELKDRSDPYEIRYDHATNLGAAGGPVFDLGTGKIFAIHIGSEADMTRIGRRIGLGVSLPMVLNTAREGAQPLQGRLPPLCEPAD